MSGTIRVGFIGAGRNTLEKHLPGLLAIEGIEAGAVCNRSQESGQRVAAAFGIPRVTTDPREIFEDPEIDAVCIGTWPYRHRDYTVAALEAGKHVLVEARMAASAQEAREMLEASRRRPDLVAQVVPAPSDFHWGATVRRMLADGLLGDIREVHVDLLSGSGIDPETPLHWRQRADYSGVNVMTVGLYIEVLHRLLGPTARVVADAETFVPQRVDPETGSIRTVDVPDSLGVFARMERDGTRVTYRVSTVTAEPVLRNTISIYGSRGTLHWVGDETLTFAPLGAAPTEVHLDPGLAASWRVEADFVDSIRSGTPVTLTSFEDALLYMRATEAIRRSAAEGRAVDLAEV